MDLNYQRWGWQLLCLLIAVVLSTTVGVERQAKHKDAGIRTHALVGLGSALFVILSKYGFNDVLLADLVRLDPSRIAAQIVSGIGFIGAGVVFMQRAHIRGLTTAASIWLTAAVGASCGAGLLIQSLACTILYLVVVIVFPLLGKFVPTFLDAGDSLYVEYCDGKGVLRTILATCVQNGFSVENFSMRNSDVKGVVCANLEVKGKDLDQLIELIMAIHGVYAVASLSSLE